jgi:DNA polymerase
MSKWTNHRDKWKVCELCPLCETRKNVVLLRGILPAPILLIGEAPGPSEDILGKPFVGPAGHLLDAILEKAIDGQYDYAITNIVACLPKSDNPDKSFEPPTKVSIEACKPRVLETIEMCNPRLIITVGTLAQKHVPVIKGIRYAHIIHPAAILRADVSQQGLQEQRAAVIIEDAVSAMSETTY